MDQLMVSYMNWSYYMMCNYTGGDTGDGSGVVDYSGVDVGSGSAIPLPYYGNLVLLIVYNIND